MKAIDRHNNAVAASNAETYQRFGVHGPYEPNSEEHLFWLACYDAYILTSLGCDLHQ